jgi:aminoglycoside 6'-N-acetyltransferase
MPAAHDLPTLIGERLTLRPVREEDAEALAAMLAEPDVAHFWGRYDVARVREELLDPKETLVIVVGGEPAGLMLVDEETDPMYRAVGLDISLVTRLHGQGYGREALRLVIGHFVGQGHHRFTIDPRADNERAIRAYAAVGFRPVGVLRQYERDADGALHDGLLMDLVAAEFAG